MDAQVPDVFGKAAPGYGGLAFFFEACYDKLPISRRIASVWQCGVTRKKPF